MIFPMSKYFPTANSPEQIICLYIFHYRDIHKGRPADRGEGGQAHADACVEEEVRGSNPISANPREVR